MKIALTSLYLPSTSKIGVGYQVHGLANALTARGHRVTVFSPSTTPEDASYEVITIPKRRRMHTFGFAWDLRQLKFDEFDVLNAHGDDWFLWGVKRPRHVHTYHGSCFAEMLNARGLVGKLRMGMLALCESQVRFMVDETVSVSENTRRFIGGIRHIIPCGVDLSQFRPSGAKSSAPSVLFVGTMHGRKRGRMLLEAFLREIQSQIPDAELWCVCDRPDDAPACDRVKWMGRVSNEELVRLYQSAWVFCLPSTYEGFGVPYIEAMACGVPVVATPNPGAVEVTANGQYGVLATEETLAGKIVDLLKDEPTRRRMAEAGLQRAQRFSWDSVCEDYEAIYTNREPLQHG